MIGFEYCGSFKMLASSHLKNIYLLCIYTPAMYIYTPAMYIYICYVYIYLLCIYIYIHLLCVYIYLLCIYTPAMYIPAMYIHTCYSDINMIIPVLSGYRQISGCMNLPVSDVGNKFSL